MLALRTSLVAAMLFLLGGQAAGAWMQLSGDDWVSPTYGFSVSWAGTGWEADANAMLTGVGPEKLDRLHLINGESSLYIEGATRYNGDLSACIEAEANLLGQEAGVSDLRPYVDEHGSPFMADGPNGSAAAFQLTLDAGGQNVDLVDYLECRTLVPGESVLIVTLIAETPEFLHELAEIQPVLATIETSGDGNANALAEYGRLLAAAQSQPSLTGPRAGEITFAAGKLGVERLGVHEADVYARATFQHPEPADIALWDVGLGFRDTGGDNQYRLIVDSEGRWFFKLGQGAVIAQGQIDDFDASAGGSNTLEVVTQGDTGYFAFNERLVTELDLSGSDAAGDVLIGAGFFAEDATQPGLLPFADVEVWAVPATAPAATPVSEAPVAAPEEGPSAGQVIPQAASSVAMNAAGIGTLAQAAMAKPPVAGPSDGSLMQQEGAASVAGAGVSLDNFVADVTFQNASDASEQPWDVGIAFREQPNGDHYRVTIDSTGRWQFQIGTQPPLSGGVLPSVNFAAGAPNELMLVVDGGHAGFIVNGLFVAQLDTSALSGAADVWVGSGFRRDNVRPGAITNYVGFRVWDIPAGVGGGAEPEAVQPAPERVALRLHEVGDSGVDALGDLTGDDAGVTLTVVTRDAAGDEVTGLFAGSCRSLPEAPLEVLPPLDDRGQTSLELAAPLSEFTSSRHAVALIGALDTVVACGDIAAGA